MDGVTVAQFVMLTPYPGTVDFASWEKSLGDKAASIGGIPVTRHWLIPQSLRPKVYTPHPVMSPDEIRARNAALLGAAVGLWIEATWGPVMWVLLGEMFPNQFPDNPTEDTSFT